MSRRNALLVSLLATYMGCATAPQQVPVELPVADTNCQVTYDNGAQKFYCGNIEYDLRAEPLDQKVESFGPVIPATIIRTNSVKTTTREFKYKTEQWEGERHPHTVWLETPLGMYKFEIDRAGKVWGAQKIEEQK